MKSFRNVTICRGGELLGGRNIVFSAEDGLIHSTSNSVDQKSEAQGSASLPLLSSAESIPLEDPSWIIAPGFLELQTNGLMGVHFTTLGQDGVSDRKDEENLIKVAEAMAKNGVTGWWATVPTVHESRWPQILRHLHPRTFPTGSCLLGAHVEGPYLASSKKGAHDDSFFKIPDVSSIHQLYGEGNIPEVIKMITVAPELPHATEMIRDLKTNYPDLVVSLGHSEATYDQGLQGLAAGATTLTHLFNAMNPLHHRQPGLVGLVSLTPNSSSRPDSPYFSLIPDYIHLHPSVLRLTFNANPTRAILITDSIELAGMPDGIYEPNGQITYPQLKVGNRATNVPKTVKVTLESGEVKEIKEKETLIGSCITLVEGVNNMAEALKPQGESKPDNASHLAKAVCCVTENIAGLMGLKGKGGRGELEEGRRADFVVLSYEAGLLTVKQTWVAGKKVWDENSQH